jgi:hypothetical protein
MYVAVGLLLKTSNIYRILAMLLFHGSSLVFFMEKDNKINGSCL